MVYEGNEKGEINKKYNQRKTKKEPMPNAPIPLSYSLCNFKVAYYETATSACFTFKLFNIK